MASNMKIVLMSASALTLGAGWQASACAASGPAEAANTNVPSATAPQSGELQTVVVTAEKRATNLQRTAAAVQPISNAGEAAGPGWILV